MNSRNRNWNITINGETLPKESELKEQLLTLNAEHFAFIYHDKDRDENNELKREHIHLVLTFANARDFNALSKKLKGYHLEPVITLSKSIQYLTHLNDNTKYQYKKEEIITDNEVWLDALYNSYDYINDEKVLIDEIVSGLYSSITEIIISKRYSMVWLNQRWKMLEQLLGVYGASQSFYKTDKDTYEEPF